MRAVTCLKVGVDTESIEVDVRTGRVRDERLARAPDAAASAALELALGLGAAVTVVAAGPEDAVQPALRTALACGAAAAVVLDGAVDELEAIDVARALAPVCAGADVVLCGARSVDEGSGVVAPALAALLDAAFVTDVERITVGSDGLLITQRRAGGAIAELVVGVPAVLGVHPEAARLRAPALRAVLRARGEPIRREHLPAAAGVTTLPAGPARARPRPVPAPTSPDPWARTWELVSAALPSREGRILTGDADVLAGALLAFLAEHGIT